MICKQSMPVKYNLPKKKLQPFIDNSFISFDKTDNFFLTATCSVLFEVTFLLMLFGLLPKFVCLTKSAISFLLA